MENRHLEEVRAFTLNTFRGISELRSSGYECSGYESSRQRIVLLANIQFDLSHPQSEITITVDNYLSDIKVNEVFL